jgi:hypothetical protein
VKSAHDMFAKDYGTTSFAGIGGVFLLGVGSLVLGVVVMMLCQLADPTFFKGGKLTFTPPADPLSKELKR